ncbi:MAG: chemotaxis protein CheR [Nitrospirota bacterium]|nr:MAG: chemotaxis protein CheR [Nitrospirota bacterium]
MKDSEGIPFLQWCLPRLHLRWPGFRKVRRQVYRRIDRRMKELGIKTVPEYQSYLATHSAEWLELEKLCWISISRFYRDKRVFECLERNVLPHLARRTLEEQEHTIRCLCIGCAAGEEPFTLAILWNLVLSSQYPTLGLRIFATDADPHAIERAQRACYPASSLKDLPDGWRDKAFSQSQEGFCLKEEFRVPVTFQEEDVRSTGPEGRFHLILCRYLVFTYFDEEMQLKTLNAIMNRLLPGGALVIGKTESLPEGTLGVEAWREELKIFRKGEERAVLDPIA